MCGLFGVALWIDGPRSGGSESSRSLSVLSTLPSCTGKGILGCPKISHCMSKRRSRLSSSSIVLDYLQFKMPPRRRRRHDDDEEDDDEARGAVFMRECFCLRGEHRFALVRNQQCWLRRSHSHTRHVEVVQFVARRIERFRIGKPSRELNQ